METPQIYPIQKEAIPRLTFQAGRTQQAEGLAADLAQAATLGNLYHNKVKIFFQSLQGQYVVETTIWATTSAYICLKGGITLPVQAITALQLI